MKWIAYFSVAGLLGAGIAVWQMDERQLAGLTNRSHASVPANHKPPARRTLFAAGIVEGSTRQAPLRFEIAGRLKTLEVREGTRVRKHQPLARLDDAVLQQRLEEAKAKLLLARAERNRLINGSSQEARKLARTEAALAQVRVEQAQSELKRVAHAYEKGALTIDDYEKSQYQLKLTRARWASALARVNEVEAKVRSDDLKVADAKVKLAESAVDEARVMLAKTILRAPADGVMLRIDAEPGEMLGPESAARVLTFVDDSVIQVRAYVEELDALSLRVGQSAGVVADGLPNKRYAGRITWIAPSMQHKSVLHQKPGEHVDVKVREVLIRIETPDKLVIGLPVDVFLEPVDTTPPPEQKQQDNPSDQPKQPLAWSDRVTE